MKKSLTAAFIVAALSLTACGGGDDGRPSKDEVKKALTSKDSVFGSSIPKAAADCVAGVFVDSDLSDKTLNAIVDGDEGYDGTDKDKKALSGLTADIGKCVAK
jgi:hypothetical protein